VTSATDLVAFGISSSSKLPALASFCGYAAIGVFFLWLFAATFFAATLVLDERRQRDNRRECVCCLTRKLPLEEDDGAWDKEGSISRYFRSLHGPAILSKPGKALVMCLFAGFLAFGLYGTLNLTVEDTQRAFIPADSYVQTYLDTSDEFFDTGIDLAVVFEGSTEIYEARVALADLQERVSGLSEQPPYIAEPTSDQTYQNVMTSLSMYLNETSNSTEVALGPDNWPTTEEGFVRAMKEFVAFGSPGYEFATDVVFGDDGLSVEAVKVELKYVRLVKTKGNEIIDDSDKQIEAMDATRALVESWDDTTSTRFPYSEKFLEIEGFKIIKKELFLNVGLAIISVGVIVLFTIASPITAILVTLNVAACIIEILGCMMIAGIVIDSVSVINIVLAVGLSVDYSAHVGHCFMMKGGTDRNARALEALADIGSAVLSGAISTFLAVVVLLFSSSYVFVVLSKQFALTVVLGVIHGLVFLPVMLSLVGPKAFSSAEPPKGGSEAAEEPVFAAEEEEGIPEKVKETMDKTSLSE